MPYQNNFNRGGGGNYEKKYKCHPKTNLHTKCVGGGVVHYEGRNANGTNGIPK